MSGVYIPGMEMPISCRHCPFRHMSLTENSFCIASQETINYVQERTKRLENCPLIPVPPHGRLIDADAAAKQGWTISRTYSASPTVNVYEVKTMTDEVLPTIIPAEEIE